MLRQSAAQSSELRLRVAALSAGSVPARLARLLCWLSWRMGIRDARGIFVPLRLTRRDLSGMVGCRVETTIRILGQWVRQGLLSILREGIVVCKPEELRIHCRSESTISGKARARGAQVYPTFFHEGIEPCAFTA